MGACSALGCETVLPGARTWTAAPFESESFWMTVPSTRWDLLMCPPSCTFGRSGAGQQVHAACGDALGARVCERRATAGPRRGVARARSHARPATAWRAGIFGRTRGRLAPGRRGRQCSARCRHRAVGMRPLDRQPEDGVRARRLVVAPVPDVLVRVALEKQLLGARPVVDGLLRSCTRIPPPFFS